MLGERPVDVLDLLAVLLRNRRRIAGATIAALALGIAVAALLKPTFTAGAIILPPQQQQSSAAALAGQLGSLLGGGTAAGLGLKNPGDLYVGMLQSRTIADRIIAKFDLMSVYGTKRMEDAREALKKHARFEAGKNGLIDISVEDHVAQRASDMANAYVDELHAMNSTLAISEASQRRVFFDQQLEEEKAALTAAESDLKSTQERTGLIQLGGQAESIIRGIAEVEAEISSREVELQAGRAFATDQNPEMVRLQEEIAALRRQLAKLEDDRERLAPGDTQVPASRVPGAGLEYARKLREVKYHETLVDLLSRQYEAARIDEAKSAPIIQVIDRAVPPDKKSAPHRLLLSLEFGLGGFCATCVWILARDRLKTLFALPKYASQWRELTSLLGR